MKRITGVLFFLFITMLLWKIPAQDSLDWKGQMVMHMGLNSRNTLPMELGGRYIPQVNYENTLKPGWFLDLEASANIYGYGRFHLFDSVLLEGKIKPYRLWTRFSTNQLEIRLGLQKINFGSASLLRPLMWFDRIDPRDPLKLTDGVWGLLARYYFLNNANLWLWSLYGNNDLKGWERLPSYKKLPEFGGRFQTLIPGGEAGLTYHHRIADGTVIPDSTGYVKKIAENRFGFDAKFDMVLGWWIEASVSSFVRDIGILSNQKVINIGADYTFGVGNGLTVAYEQLIVSSSREILRFDDNYTFSLISMTYPVGLFSNAGAIIYYDWKNEKIYNFINLQLRFSRLTLHLMGYLNPKEYFIPSQGDDSIQFSGNGAMIMLVFNH